MLVQINKKLNTKDFNKEELNTVVENYNSIEYWESVEVNPTQLLELITEGYSYRSGIKLTGNKKKDISTIEFISFDFDKILTEQSFFEMVQNGLINDSVSIIYPTPSYTPQIPKFRVVHLYDRVVTPLEHEKIYQFLLDKCYTTADKGCYDAGRFFYGCNQEYAGKAIIFKDCKLLEANKMLQLIEKQKSVDLTPKNVTKNASPKSSNNLEADLVQALLTKFGVAELLDISINDLFPLHPRGSHDLKPITVDNPEQFSMKWTGYNPFSPTDSSGDSFVVSYGYDNQKLPCWYDRSNNAKTDNGKSGGNYFEYWKLLKSVSYKGAVELICKHFEISLPKPTKASQKEKFAAVFTETFELTTEEIISKFILWFPNYIKTVSDNWQQSQSPLYFYLTNCNQWNFGNKGSIWSDLIVPRFLKKLLINPNNPESEKFLLMNAGEIKNLFFNKFFGIVDIKATKLNKQPKVKENFVAFSNGYFNLETKEFVDDAVNVYNLKAYDFPYRVVNDSSYLQKLEDYFNLSYKGKGDDGSIIFVWALLNILRVAHRTENHLVLMGEAGSGKTTNLNVILNLCGSFGNRANESDFSSHNKFGTNNHIGYYTLGINEYTGKKDTAILMNDASGTGTSAKIAVEPKGKSSYQVDVNWAFTLVCENDPFIKTTDGGQIRRFRCIKHDSKNNRSGTERSKLLKMSQEFSVNPLEQEETYNDLVQNIILYVHQHLDIDELLSKWKLLTDTEQMKQLSMSIAAENCIYNDLIQTHLEITNSPDDYVTLDTMKTLVNNWNRNNTSGEKIKFGASRYVTNFRKDLANFYYWKLNGYATNRVGRERKTCFYGIKLAKV